MTKGFYNCQQLNLPIADIVSKERSVLLNSFLNTEIYYLVFVPVVQIKMILEKRHRINITH